ncbi:hypothetical protein [Aequorivita xiaoshiensis]|uniref:Uncharacterized protein n=1 Tax=Aequorivita xiaoshiensis TaxID=2874476 RepID=A0A9X1QYY4_9FLAO|nr:hypothetical protein [Aequorivita xiaoshiensis]MCG2429700.1 hypothetical protein [Aequorivita xiaoshiensis]
MISFLYTVVFLALQSVTETQGPPPPARDGDPEGPQLPIDDNLWILLAVGLMFGIYILYKRNQVMNRAASDS